MDIVDSQDPQAGYDWRRERKAGATAIFVSAVFFAALWFGIRYYAPIPAGMDDVGARMLFGLALYSPDGDAMRAVLATTIAWIVARLAFWAGYHRSAAMRGIGAPGAALRTPNTSSSRMAFPIPELAGLCAWPRPTGR